MDRWDWESTGEHVPELVTATILENGNVELTMEMANGDVIHVGEHSGMTADYLESLFDQMGDDLFEYLADVIYDEEY